MTRYIHQAGQHTSRPFQFPNIRRNRYVVRAAVQFGAASRYALPGAEQADWNKLFGLDFSPFTPGNWSESAYCAWRFYEGRFQLGLYAHGVRGSRILPEDGGNWMDVPEGATVTVALVQDIEYWSLLVQIPGQNMKRFSCPAYVTGKWSRRLNPWFGGNNPAPSEVSFNLDFL